MLTLIFHSDHNNKKSAVSCWSTLLIFTAISLFTSQVSAQTLRLVGDPWPPYVEGNLGEATTTGIAVEVVKQIFSRIDGAQASFPLIPWKRALREVEEGKSDGIVMLLKTSEREQYMEYSDFLLTGENLVWSAPGKDGKAFEWVDLEDLKGQLIGVTQGYSYGELLDPLIERGEIDVVYAPTVEHLFAMLAHDRIKLAIANNAVGYSLARKYPTAGIVPAQKSTNTEMFYLALSKKSPARELMPAINAAIKSMRAEMIIDQIIRGE